MSYMTIRICLGMSIFLYLEQGDESLCDSLGVSRQDVDAAELLLKDMDSFCKIRNGITSDYIKLSKSKVEDI